MHRNGVFTLLNVERDRQERIVKERGYAPEHSLGDHLVLIRQYLNQTYEKYTHHAGNDEALRELVKLVALGVRCLEQLGDVLVDSE